MSMGGHANLRSWANPSVSKGVSPKVGAHALHRAAVASSSSRIGKPAGPKIADSTKRLRVRLEALDRLRSLAMRRVRSSGG